ncbi:hypothetical protein F5B21DRAFT_36820 [Xylaria acuta]|nr:hypothetical protein F5B21DRAFT_36820 [Xylaria acuta]
MCKSNTPAVINGLSLALLATNRSKRIPWQTCCKNKMWQHLARHRIGPDKLRYLYFEELVVALNCDFPEYVHLVYDKIKSSLAYKLKVAEKEGSIRYEAGREGGREVVWGDWTREWLREGWDGDRGQPRGGRGQIGVESGHGLGRRSATPSTYTIASEPPPPPPPPPRQPGSNSRADPSPVVARGRADEGERDRVQQPADNERTTTSGHSSRATSSRTRQPTCCQIL